MSTTTILPASLTPVLMSALFVTLLAHLVLRAVVPPGDDEDDDEDDRRRYRSGSQLRESVVAFAVAVLTCLVWHAAVPLWRQWQYLVLGTPDALDDVAGANVPIPVHTQLPAW